jgi:AraC-like DNA-binding protein
MHPVDVATVHVSNLLILARHLERRGHDLTAWWREVAFPEALGGDPDARVPVETIRRAWREAVALTRSPVLALEVGADHSAIAHSMLGHLIAHSDTLGEALRGLCRYFVFISGGMTLSLEGTEESAHLVARNPDPHPELWPDVLARTFAAAFTVSRDETAGKFRLERTEWNHPAPPHRPAYDAFFGVRSVFGAATSRLVFDRTMLDLPLAHRNTELKSFFEQRLESRTAALIEPKSARDHLRQKLGGLIDRGELSAGDAAKAMAVSLRSLHRALAAEGTTFQAELDAVRRERCIWLLDEGRQPLENVAFACGFAEPSGFYRAFRRWTGKTPRQYRVAAG